MDDRLEIAKAFRTLRIAKGLTIKEMADKCGYTERHISLIERGGYLPKIQTLQDMAGVFGMKVKMTLQSSSGEEFHAAPRNGKMDFPKKRKSQKGDRSFPYEICATFNKPMMDYINKVRLKLDLEGADITRFTEAIRFIIQERMDRENETGSVE